MILYFQYGKNHRLAIDFNIKRYSTNYSVLGGYHHYIKISRMEYNDLLMGLENDFYFEKVDNI